MKTYFLDNAFWRNDEHTSATAIFITEFDSGSRESRQVELDEYLPNGQKCSMFADLVLQLGEEKITKSTEERIARKKEESKNNKLKQEQEKKSAELESLFKLKIQAFDIEEVRNSTNKKLRSKLRRSKNSVELQAYVTLILMDSLNED